MPVAVKKSSTAKSPSKRAEPGDSIADDVRKIKESLKKTFTKPAPTPKKPREPATRGTPRGRGAKKEEKAVEVKAEVKTVVEEKPKEVINILADWDDDDDEMEVPKKEEKPAGELSSCIVSSTIAQSIHPSSDLPKVTLPKPEPWPEKAGESSRSIRNIPKKQRVSEVYIKAAEVEQPKVETPAKSPVKESPKKVEEPQDDAAKPEVAKKPQKANKRKIAVDSEEPKKVVDEATDDLLMATAELLNETEVPKVENAQVPSTFHKSNDIDKRNLPPKERNKRIFRANNAESPSTMPTENNGSMTKVEEPVVASPIQNELMLPHKKKQSSRLAATEKPSPVRETRNVRQEVPLHQELPIKLDAPVSPPAESRTRKKRKSTEPMAVEVEINSHKVLPTEAEPEVTQSPLREPAEAVPTEPPHVPNSTSSPRRGVKRQNSKDLHELTQDDPDVHSEPKKLHKSSTDTQPKTIVACASETICITSKGLLEKTGKDSIVTTEANTVMVTSQIIITEAILQPIVSSAPTQSPKMQISANTKSPAPKDALKVPPEQLKEMKKQGLVIEEGGKQKLTKEGRIVFKKQLKDKTVDAEKKEPEPEPAPEQVVEEPAVVAQKADPITDLVNPETIAEAIAVPADTESRVELDSRAESPEVEESTNNNDIEKEAIVSEPSTPSKEPQHEEPVENGKEADTDADSQSDDPNGGSGLIALQADTFGGPQNCFYLCRQIEDRYEPVDNQILVLNQHNALVPFEGDIEALSTQGVVAESMSSYPQLSPNANIIINTPNGQKIELNQYAIQALQEQADENGIASIELSGEQLELNIHGILEAIHAQQEGAEAEGIIPGTMLIDGESALILDVPELPIEMNHSATQVNQTFNKPIMSTEVAPEITSVKATITDSTKNLNIEDSLASIGVTTQPTRSNVPKSLELPITITNPTIAGEYNRHDDALGY